MRDDNNLDDITDPADTDADDDTDGEQHTNENIDEHTVIRGRIAIYTGDGRVDAEWSMTEAWACSHDYRRLKRQDHADVLNLRGFHELDVKGCAVRHADGDHGKIIIRKDQHETLLSRRDRKGVGEPKYHVVVRRDLDPGIIYMAADSIVHAADMDDICRDYSWVGYHRNDNTIDNLQIPWPGIPGLGDTEEIERRARLMHRLYNVVSDYDADTVRDVLSDFEDLTELLLEHDKLPRAPAPYTS